MKKPSLERYYKNLKTGQYCSLEGSKLAINDIETRQWKRQKVSVKRIPKREFKAAVFEANGIHCILGYHYPYLPNVLRKGRSKLRKGNKVSGHKLHFSFYPY